MVATLSRHGGQAVEGERDDEFTAQAGSQIDRVVRVAFGRVEFALRISTRDRDVNAAAKLQDVGGRSLVWRTDCAEDCREGVAAVTVAIDNAPFKGVLPLPISSLKSASPVLGNPLNHGKAIALTFDQFKYGWANNLDDSEARELYETFHVPASGAPPFQAAVANFIPFGGETRPGKRSSHRH